MKIPPTNIGLRRVMPVALAAGLLFTAVAGQFSSAQAQSNSFADPAFKRVWERTDLLVAQGKVSRTWIWGPSPGRSLQEPFKEGPGGTHLVQYFDKARMEINNPSGNPADPFYVTNGLLAVEMISGRMQIGSNEFESHEASELRIAGDEGSDAPTYAALKRVASVGLPNSENRAAPQTVGARIPSTYMDRLGQTKSQPPESALPAYNKTNVKVAAYASETGHNIPDVFWTYMNSQGPIFENGVTVNALLFNWVSAFGYPVTEPYWTTIHLNGVGERLVLFQAFQRRILTYSPDNPEGWKVEMGNVGAQYYSWRYDTLVLNCRQVPVRGFGKVWANHRNVQRGVGCPIIYGPGNETALQTAFQPFEHGTMLWVNPTVPVYPNVTGPTIYVFFDDGTLQRFDDTWREGQPANAGLTPPAGRYEPVRGFGKVWREGTGVKVRERLGWATAPEKGAPGAYQQFDRGEMFWSGAVNKIWVLYGTVSAGGYPQPTPGPAPSPYSYDVYDDTFAP
jgi:hypothetical protein